MYQQIARNKRRAVAWMAVFFLAWVGIGALLGWVWAAATPPSGPGLAPPTGQDVLTGVLVASLLAVGGILFSLTAGSRMVLAVSRARPADPERYPALHNLVEALALGDGIPKPAVHVIDDPSPNAFATGTSPATAAITVTTGLLALMNREELEGVLAHEMSHIKNYDVRLLLVVSTLIGMAGLLAGLVWRSGFFMGRGRRGNQAVIVVLVAGILLGILAALFGPLVRLALSRQRESLADVSGVELTRNPTGLIGALKKLQANERPPAASNAITAAMCIDNPLRHRETGLARLFDTHPPLAERIAVLERIAQAQTT